MTAPWQPEARPVATGMPSAGWLLLHSLWLIPVFAGFGRATWVGFAVIGVLALRTSWLVTAGVYAAAAAALPFVPLPDAVAIGYPALWVAGIVHALLVGPAWLREAWRRREAGERWVRRARRPASPEAPATRTVDVPAVSAAPFGVDARAYYAPATPPQETTAHPAPVAPPAAPAGIDPQQADAAVLASLPFMGPARAEYVVAHRDAHPVRSLDDLIALLRLQPHEAVAMRPFLVFAPLPAMPPPAAGRILDV